MSMQTDSAGGSSPATDPSNGAPASGRDSVDSTTGSQGGGQPGEPAGHLIPKERFDEAVKKEREGRERAETFANEAVQKNNQWVQWAEKNKHLLEAKRSTDSVESGNGETDLAEEYVRSLFGDDEGSQGRYDAMEKYFNHKQGKAPTMDQIAQFVDQRVNGAMGQVNSSFTVANYIDEGKRSGIFDTDGAAWMHQEINKQFQANPTLAQDPNNVRYVLQRLETTLHRQKLANGDTVSFEAPQPPSALPLQSGNGAPPADTVEEMQPASSKLGKLRNMDPAKLKHYQALSLKRHEQATT